MFFVSALLTLLMFYLVLKELKNLSKQVDPLIPPPPPVAMPLMPIYIYSTNPACNFVVWMKSSFQNSQPDLYSTKPMLSLQTGLQNEMKFWTSQWFCKIHNKVQNLIYKSLPLPQRLCRSSHKAIAKILSLSFVVINQVSASKIFTKSTESWGLNFFLHHSKIFRTVLLILLISFVHGRLLCANTPSFPI